MSIDALVLAIIFLKKSYFSITPFIGLTGNSIFLKSNHFLLGGMVNTGQEEIFTTFCAVEPMKNSLNPDTPWVPIIIKSASISAAVLIIECGTKPTFTSEVKFNWCFSFNVVNRELSIREETSTILSIVFSEI